jgi:hypothetical protein
MKHDRRSALAVALSLATLAGSATVTSSASAHFVLVSPKSARSQDPLGSPQKLAPCGDEGGGTDTGVVTTFKPGETIDITIDETIFHPGHYRISLAVNDRSEFPTEPVVTPGGGYDCGSAPIDAAPSFPVLADGVFKHTTPFAGPQTIKVTLPSNITCTHCTIQVLEFMSDHGLNIPGGCYYHHCADLSISALGDGGTTTTPVDAGDAPTSGSSSGGTPTSDGGTPAGKQPSGAGDAGAANTAGDSGSSGGCSVSLRGAKSTASFVGLFSLALAALAFVRARRTGN